MKKILLLLVLLQIPLSAQTNLEYFIRTAIGNNPQLKEFAQASQISKYEREMINAENVLPKISLTANYLFSPYFNNSGKLISAAPDPNAIGYDAGITNGGLYSAMINLDKNIFNGYLTGALENQVVLKENAAKNNIQLLQHDLEKQVTDQYLTAYLSFRMNELEAEVLSYLKKEEAVTSKLLENGLISESDNLLLKIEIDNQSNILENSNSQFRSNLSQLYALCGLKDTAVAKLDSVSLKQNNPAGSSSYFRKYEIDSLALMNQQEIFESKYQPQLSLFFNTGLNAVELEGIQRKFGLSAGINFTLPIYDGDQKSIQRQQNELSVKSLSNYREYFSLQLKIWRNASLSRISALKKNLENYGRQIISYQKVISITEKEMNQGNISMVDYLTILKNFIDLKKNNVSAQNEYQMEINNYNYWNW